VGELFQLDEKIRYATGRNEASYTPGLTRAVAQLFFRQQTEEGMTRALAWLKDRGAWRSDRMLRYLLALTGGRIGVDKSPRTCLATRSLRRAIAWSPETRFLHLTREPVRCVASILRGMDPGANAASRAMAVRDRARFAVEFWLHAQQNILRETGEVAARLLRVRGEDLINHADQEKPRILQWLGLKHAPEEVEAMLHPERSPYAHPGPWPSAGDQDPGFLAAPSLRQVHGPEAEAIPEQWELSECHRRELLRLSRALGYA
jgi:hypothetical protein